MIEQDTVKLLRECDAGIKMGISSIDDVLDRVEDRKLRELLGDCKAQHEELQTQIIGLLADYNDRGKDPAPIAKGMSWMKTNLKMTLEGGDATIADLMTDGCDMGVKSLSRYLNQYEAADERSKDIAKKLIAAESDLSIALRDWL